MSMASQKTGHREGYGVREYVPDTKPGMLKVRVFGEVYQVWPLHCMRGWKCVQCVVEGKIQCEARFANMGG